MQVAAGGGGLCAKLPKKGLPELLVLREGTLAIPGEGIDADETCVCPFVGCSLLNSRCSASMASPNSFRSSYKPASSTSKAR
jgi:hypothetical protein